VCELWHSDVGTPTAFLKELVSLVSTSDNGSNKRGKQVLEILVMPTVHNLDPYFQLQRMMQEKLGPSIS
jgi:hypothetical protein